ncbi:MAG TPA: phosphate ABC transporter substrate-binding protein [Caldilineae bacterium]|nr:phosphate ABC transporter substrate-binding protein [Caldilineae bacterium]
MRIDRGDIQLGTSSENTLEDPGARKAWGLSPRGRKTAEDVAFGRPGEGHSPFPRLPLLPSRFLTQLLIAGPLLLAGLVLLIACDATAGTPTPITLRIAGSTSMAPLLRELAEALQEQHAGVNVLVEGGDTTFGLSLLADGDIDMAAASWLPKEIIQDSWETIPIAWDGIAIVVHPDNPLEGLTMLQLRRVFAGWAFHWEDVGAPGGGEEDQPIQVLSREEGSGTRAAFEERVMGSERVTLTALMMPSSQAVIDYIAVHPQAIGYVSMGWVDDRVKVLRIEGLQPTPETVADGRYHLARPLYLITRDEPSGAARIFIDFALRPTGQAIVSKRYGPIR